MNPAASVDAPCGRTPAGHLLRQGAGEWHLWRNFECRTAGFPATLVLDLGDEPCAEVADRWLQAEALAQAQWEAARAQVKAQVKQTLETIRRLPDASPQRIAAEEALRRLRIAAKAIDRRSLSSEAIEALGGDLSRKLEDAERAMTQTHAEFLRRFGESEARASAALSHVARDERFREAVAWQNKSVVRTVLDALAGQTPSSASERRRREDLVGNYVQRYATKNDTIGFFGPVGWAHWMDQGPAVTLRGPADRLAERTVYFEDWAIQALCERWSADERMLPWLVPVRAPFLRVDGRTLHLPGGATLPLSAEESAVLLACDGTRTSRDIASALSLHPFLDFGSEGDVLSLIVALVQSRRIVGTLAVRTADATPENHLRTQLQAVADPALRREALSQLDTLESARAFVAASAGDAARLQAALHELDETFQRLTQTEAVRHAGQTYGGRTLVYEDCRRAMDVEFGPQLMRELQPPLDLLLTSARWFCHEIAQVFEAAMQEIVHTLQGGDGASPVDFPTFWLHAQGLFREEPPAGIAQVRQELAARWERILAIGDGDTDIQRHSPAMAAAVADAFRAPDCGWPLACHHSPDVMIAADGADAIERGDCLFVLGEIHVGINTLVNHSALNQHTNPESLLSALHHDLGAPRILPLMSSDGTPQPIRVRTVPDMRQDMELRLSYDALPLDPASALDASDLRVLAGPRGLVASTRDGRRQYPLLHVLGPLLSGFVADKFQITSPRDHMPRITIDKLVIQRRTWRFPCEDLQFLLGRQDADAFAQLRQWARGHALPRQVFVKVPWEKKPFYMDFASPVFTRMLVRHLRRGANEGAGSPMASLRLSEMLPTHEQLWMPLGPSHRCTSELRLVAIHGDDIACGARAA